MTNNQHGQVPEALIDLIDAYAETRHRCGGIYNAKTEAARNAVIEALSGVQALSAAPAVLSDEAILNRTGCIDYSPGTAEYDLELIRWYRTQIASPAPQQSRPLSHPNREFPGLAQGAAITSESGAVYAPMPRAAYIEFDGREETAWHTPDQMRDFADRTHALRQAVIAPELQAEARRRYDAAMEQAAPKAAPGVGDELRDTLVAVSAAIAERDDRAAQKMICEILAASTTPPAEQPIGEVVVTKTKDGQIVAVTRQDDEGRILSVIATSDPAEQQATKETSGGFHVWRDISTAPKDGSRFVAIGYNYGLYSEGRHTCVAQWFRGCWMEVSDWNETSELGYLTHWMPLPSPPDDVAAPAEQQAAPKAAPGDALDEAMRERDEAEDFINELLDEVLGADRPEWSSAYNRYDAMSDVRERITALHKPAVDKAWGQFQSAMAAPQQEAQEPTEIPEEIERMAADRYKVVPSHESMFHRWAVVAGTGTQQLYLGREVECQNMARKFAGAFLDGAFVAMQRTAPQPAPAPLSDDVVKDAARYRWLRENWFTMTSNYQRCITFKVGEPRWSDITEEELDAAIDAALAAQGGKDAG